jgi:hypothetical protein
MADHYIGAKHSQQAEKDRYPKSERHGHRTDRQQSDHSHNATGNRRSESRTARSRAQHSRAAYGI